MRKGPTPHKHLRVGNDYDNDLNVNPLAFWLQSFVLSISFLVQQYIINVIKYCPCGAIVVNVHFQISKKYSCSQNPKGERQVPFRICWLSSITSMIELNLYRENPYTVLIPSYPGPGVFTEVKCSPGKIIIAPIVLYF